MSNKYRQKTKHFTYITFAVSIGNKNNIENNSRGKKESNNQQVNDDVNNHYLVNYQLVSLKLKTAFTKSGYNNQTLSRVKPLIMSNIE